MSVQQYSSLYQQAGAKYGVQPSVIAALVQTETDGNETEVSSVGARGLTQFMPDTARQYGVNTSPGHARSQIFGAAHYLRDLGYAKDPHLALASYNAGPGNPGAGSGYADTVLGRAKKYLSLDSGTLAPAVNLTDAQGTANAGAGASATGGAQTDQGWGTGLISPILNAVPKALLYIAFIIGGAALIGLGARRTATGATT
jgi:membrane-bound lytic murein transglycosylase B